MYEVAVGVRGLVACCCLEADAFFRFLRISLDYRETVKQLEVCLECIFDFRHHDELVGSMAASTVTWSHLHGREVHESLVREGRASEGNLAHGYGAL